MSRKSWQEKIAPAVDCAIEKGEPHLMVKTFPVAP